MTFTCSCLHSLQLHCLHNSNGEFITLSPIRILRLYICTIDSPSSLKRSYYTHSTQKITGAGLFFSLFAFYFVLLLRILKFFLTLCFVFGSLLNTGMNGKTEVLLIYMDSFGWRMHPIWTALIGMIPSLLILQKHTLTAS